MDAFATTALHVAVNKTITMTHNNTNNNEKQRINRMWDERTALVTSYDKKRIIKIGESDEERQKEWKQERETNE